MAARDVETQAECWQCQTVAFSVQGFQLINYTVRYLPRGKGKLI